MRPSHAVPGPALKINHITLLDRLNFGVALTCHLPPVVLACLIRRLRTQAGIGLKVDLFRSALRTLTIPDSMMQRFLSVDDPGAVVNSNRFKDSQHTLCEYILRDTFAGYWICKGSPTKPNSDLSKCDKVLLHIHGGGYVNGHPLGSLAQFLRVSELADEQGLCLGIFALNYALAPQAKIPHQAEQAVAAFCYLTQEMSIPPEKIILEGDSAGGHLALSLLVLLAGRGLISPGYCLLFYPWIDLSNSGAGWQRNQYRDVMTKKDLDHAASLVLGQDGVAESRYLRNFAEPRTCGVGPFGRNWAKILPHRTWINTGAEDCFIDDIVSFVENSRVDGAIVNFEVTSGKAHGWLTFDDSWDISSYCQLEASEDVGDLMAGAKAIFKGISDLLDLNLDIGITVQKDSCMGAFDIEKLKKQVSVTVAPIV